MPHAHCCKKEKKRKTGSNFCDHLAHIKALWGETSQPLLCHRHCRTLKHSNCFPKSHIDNSGSGPNAAINCFARKKNTLTSCRPQKWEQWLQKQVSSHARTRAYLVCSNVGDGQLGLVIQHLLKVGDVPGGIGGVTMKTLHMMHMKRKQSCTTLYFHFQCDTDISALNFSWYRYFHYLLCSVEC